MPISFLSTEQERRHGRYVGEPSADQFARCFHLDDADRALIATRRWDHMRLGFAVQLGTVRSLGIFLDDPTDVPAGVVADLTRQLGLAGFGCLTRYCEGRIRWQHAAEIRVHYGYRALSEPTAGFRLVRWLYSLCWIGSDRLGALFDRATAWLIAHTPPVEWEHIGFSGDFLWLRAAMLPAGRRRLNPARTQPAAA